MHIFIHAEIHNNNTFIYRERKEESEQGIVKSMRKIMKTGGKKGNSKDTEEEREREKLYDTNTHTTKALQRTEDGGFEAKEKQIKLNQPIELVTERLQIVENNSWIKCNFNFCFASNSSFIFHSTCFSVCFVPYFFAAAAAAPMLSCSISLHFFLSFRFFGQSESEKRTMV